MESTQRVVNTNIFFKMESLREPVRTECASIFLTLLFLLTISFKKRLYVKLLIRLWLLHTYIAKPEKYIKFYVPKEHYIQFVLTEWFRMTN